jgi:hypothetical protein
MGNITVKGRKVLVKRSADQLFTLFSDLNNFTGNLPPAITGKAEIASTRDTLTAKIQGVELGLKVQERVPVSLIKMTQHGNTPFPYTFLIKIESLGDSESGFELEMESDLPGMFKAMVSGKLQELVDKLTDGLENALAG